MLTKKWMSLVVVGLLVGACQAEPPEVTEATETLRSFSTATMPADIEPNLTPLADTPAVPTATPFLHTIAEGETMSGIAWRYGVSLDDLLIANPGVDPGFLTIGQTLIIPGPEGSTVSGLLPTPTPVPIQPEPVRCYPAPSDTMWCITQVENDTGTPLEGVSLMIAILDENGSVLEQHAVYSPLDILPDGGVMPFAILLDEMPDGFAGAYARVLGAVPAQAVEERYPLLDVDEEAVSISADGARAEWRGTIALQTNIPGESGALRAMLIAFEESGGVVGFRIFEGEIGASAGSQTDIQMLVFSLSPRIEAVEFLAEVEAQSP